MTPLDKERLAVWKKNPFGINVMEAINMIDRLLRENEELKSIQKDLTGDPNAECELFGKHVRCDHYKRVKEAAEMLECHPAFCVGTRSCEVLPLGVMPRMRDLREALQSLNRWEA